MTDVTVDASLWTGWCSEKQYCDSCQRARVEWEWILRHRLVDGRFHGLKCEDWVSYCGCWWLTGIGMRAVANRDAIEKRDWAHLFLLLLWYISFTFNIIIRRVTSSSFFIFFSFSPSPNLYGAGTGNIRKVCIVVSSCFVCSVDEYLCTLLLNEWYTLVFMHVSICA